MKKAAYLYVHFLYFPIERFTWPVAWTSPNPSVSAKMNRILVVHRLKSGPHKMGYYHLLLLNNMIRSHRLQTQILDRVKNIASYDGSNISVEYHFSLDMRVII